MFATVVRNGLGRGSLMQTWFRTRLLARILALQQGIPSIFLPLHGVAPVSAEERDP